MSRLKTLREYVDKELNLLEEDKRTCPTAHLYGVSLAATILAKKRGLNEELAAMAAMLHDMHAYKSGSYDNHAHLGADVIDHCFKDSSKPIKEKEQKRYENLCKELDL